MRTLTDHAIANVVHYDSLTEALNGATDRPTRSWGSNGSESWDGNVTRERAWDLARNGDPSLVGAYNDLLVQLAPDMTTDVAPAWCADVVGSTPIVASVVAGHPMAMRRRMKRTRVAKTVRVYVSLVSFCGVAAFDMVRRGAAILALIESLQSANVNVEAALVAELPCNPKDYILVMPLESPLDLSRTGFAIAHPAFARHTLYENIGEAFRFNGGWVRYDRGIGCRTGKVPREILGLAPHDVWVAMAQHNDEIIRNPKRWIETHVSQALGDESA